MSPSDWISNGLHLAVALMCFSFWWMLRKLVTVQARAMTQPEQQRIAHLQRVVDAADDWYDDVKDSKERLREIIEQRRGLKPFRLIGREGECHICKAPAGDRCDAGLHG